MKIHKACILLLPVYMLLTSCQPSPPDPNPDPTNDSLMAAKASRDSMYTVKTLYTSNSHVPAFLEHYTFDTVNRKILIDIQNTADWPYIDNIELDYDANGYLIHYKNNFAGSGGIDQAHVVDFFITYDAAGVLQQTTSKMKDGSTVINNFVKTNTSTGYRLDWTFQHPWLIGKYFAKFSDDHQLQEFVGDTMDIYDYRIRFLYYYDDSSDVASIDKISENSTATISERYPVFLPATRDTIGNNLWKLRSTLLGPGLKNLPDLFTMDFPLISMLTQDHYIPNYLFTRLPPKTGYFDSGSFYGQFRNETTIDTLGRMQVMNFQSNDGFRFRFAVSYLK